MSLKHISQQDQNLLGHEVMKLIGWALLFKTNIALKRLSGFTMVEVLIAVVVLTLGLLGIAGIQLVGLKNNDSSYLRTQACLDAYDIIDRMRANRAAAIAENYDQEVLKKPSEISAPAAGAALAQVDRYGWFQKINELPSARGAINCSTDVCKVTVEWDDARAVCAQKDIANCPQSPQIQQVIITGRL